MYNISLDSNWISHYILTVYIHGTDRDKDNGIDKDTRSPQKASVLNWGRIHTADSEADPRWACPSISWDF